MTRPGIETGGHSRGDAWVRRGCALVVAAVAAYSSYAHQRHFALTGGADLVSAALWPLSVDGLVILASLGLVRARAATTLRARVALWLAFLLGVAVSLAANIAAAPTLGWQPVLVAGWPPLALLLAVELVVHARRHEGVSVIETECRAEAAHTHASSVHAGMLAVTTCTPEAESTGLTETTNETAGEVSRSLAAKRSQRLAEPTAEAVMWAHYEAERRAGRTPTGAELDRMAGTNNYGRAVLARWRRTGRIPAPAY